MKVAVYSTQFFDREFMIRKDWAFDHNLSFFDIKLNSETAALAKGHPCVSCSVGDQLDKVTLPILAEYGVKLIALRSAGFNQVDLYEAKRVNIRVVRVPGYSPHSVAEHAVALLLALDRHIPKAYNRVRELDFSLEGLMGYDLFEKTVGIIGTGKIGSVMAKIMHGFGCHVIAYDLKPDGNLEKKYGIKYVELPELYQTADILTLHVPLTPTSRHLINADAFNQMKPGVTIINTGRGALIDTRALIAGLKTRHVRAAGLDVYVEEEGVFYEDLSEQVLKDDVLARLLTFPNVIVTSHQGFFTREAVTNIARTTLQNITDFENGLPLKNEVLPETHLVLAGTHVMVMA
jgi:D-lactate dehydrogenase